MSRIAVTASALTVAASVVTLGAAPATAAAGTSITATISAQGHLARNYPWTLNKFARPTASTIDYDAVTSPTWTIVARRGDAAASANVAGQVCATNTGAVATTGLKVTVSLSKPPSKTVLTTTILSLSPANLAAGASACWPYVVQVPAFVAGSQYKVTAAVTLTNKASGKDTGGTPSATAYLPTTPDQDTNAQLSVEDSNGKKLSFASSGSATYPTKYSCPDDAGAQVNTVSVTGWTANPVTTQPAAVSATFTLTCREPADVVVSKTATDSAIDLGDEIGFDIQATNQGASSAAGVTVSDTLDADLTWVEDSDDCAIVDSELSCDFGSLAAGASSPSVHVSATSDESVCGELSNTATVSATNEPEAQQANNSDTATVTTSCALLEITKVADASTVSGGQPVGFVISVTNGGSGAAADVTISDTLPTRDGLNWSIDAANSSSGCSITSAVLVCTTPSLGAGGTYKVHITSPTTTATCGTLNNTAYGSATDQTVVSASASVTVQCPSLTFTKTADRSSVSAGDGIGFTLTLANGGPGTALNVGITDVLPTNAGLVWTISPSVTGCSIANGTLTCSRASLGAGASLSVHVTSPTTSATCGTVTNSGLGTAAGVAGKPSGASVSVLCPSLVLEKTADADSVKAGETIGFDITVTNNGFGVAKDVTISDTLPTDPGTSWSFGPSGVDCAIASGVLSCNIGAVPPGATYRVHVGSPTTSATCGTVSNTASASASNSAASLSAGDDVLVVCSADLRISQDTDSAAVNAGDQVGFTVDVTNDGPDPAPNAFVKTALPAGYTWSYPANCVLDTGALVCDLGDLDVDASATTIHLTATTTSASCASDVSSTVKVGSDATDPDTTDNEATSSITVYCPDLQLTKIVNNETPSASTNSVWTIAVTNLGPGTAYGVVITDVLPAGLTFAAPALANNGATCVTASSTVTCTRASIPAGGSVVVTITTTQVDLCQISRFTNTATASATNEPADLLANNGDSATITPSCDA